MKKILFSLVLILGFNIAAEAQPSTLRDNTWRTLSKITFKKEYDEILGLKVDVPVFSKEVRALEGKEITIKGYIIPTDGYKGQKEFVFSAYPYNMCFFCGGAGPETVIQVYAKMPIAYTSEPIYIKGILHLNASDANSLIYSLYNAEKL